MAGLCPVAYGAGPLPARALTQCSTAKDPRPVRGPLVVLVNRAQRRLQILAAAIQDHYWRHCMGSTGTYGRARCGAVVDLDKATPPQTSSGHFSARSSSRCRSFAALQGSWARLGGSLRTLCSPVCTLLDQAKRSDYPLENGMRLSPSPWCTWDSRGPATPSWRAAMRLVTWLASNRWLVVRGRCNPQRPNRGQHRLDRFTRSDQLGSREADRIELQEAIQRGTSHAAGCQAARY